MNISIEKIKNILFFNKCNNSQNIKKLGNLISCSNLISCTIFYIWFLLKSKNDPQGSSSYLVIISALFHIYLNSIFITWSLSYKESKWITWGWLCILFISPTGIGLLAKLNDKNSIFELKGKDESDTAYHSFANSFVNLSKQRKEAVEYLKKTYPGKIEEMLKQIGLSEENMEEWNNFATFLFISLQEALKQTKKTNTFDDVVFNAHWYDNRRFTFAIRDPKSKLMPVRYKYSLAFIVLDEFNNYQKILDGKKEIKANIKFGPAKTVCLHWGKGFKVYVNE